MSSKRLGPTLALSPMSSVVQRPIRWLWTQRLALGKLAIVSGDPGLGKSFLTLDLAARVSRDGIMPDGFQGPVGDVLLFSAEDDAGDTLKPRLIAAGANLDRVHFVEGVAHAPHVRRTVIQDEGRPAVVNERIIDPTRVGDFGLANVEPLRNAMEQVRPKLIVIDPISAYLGDTDSNNNTAVRGLLAQLNKLAGHYDCAILIVSHLSKAPEGQTKAIYRTLGSMAFVAAVRSGWMVTLDKADPTLRLFSQIKNNIGRRCPSISYRLTHDEAYDCPKLVWDTTPREIELDEELNEPKQDPGRPATAMEKAVAFIREFLADGPQTRAKTVAAAVEKDLKYAVIDRAAKAIGVQKTTNIDKVGNILWTLPPEESIESIEDVL